MFKNKYRVTKPRGRTTTSSSSRPSKRGLFANGIWLCDCDPRLPAERFQVKKDGKNKGRWFYTCQKAQELRCNFFLWADDAALRMEATVLANGPTEPSTATATATAPPSASPVAPPRNDPEWPTRPSPSKRRTLPWATESNDKARPSPSRHARGASPTVSPPPLTRHAVTNHRTPNKTHDIHHEAQQDEEEDPFALSSGDEAALAALPTTPHKPQPHAPGDHATPHRPPRAAPTGLPTPGTTPHAKAKAEANPPSPAPAPAPAPDAAPPSPSPQRTSADTATTTTTTTPTSLPTTPNPTEQSLHTRVLALLRTHGTQIPPAAAAPLRALLETEARRAAGLARGRDAARSAVAARDARIAGLAGRVARLEGDVDAERGLRRAVVRRRRWGEEEREDGR